MCACTISSLCFTAVPARFGRSIEKVSKTIFDTRLKDEGTPYNGILVTPICLIGQFVSHRHGYPKIGYQISSAKKIAELLCKHKILCCVQSSDAKFVVLWQPIGYLPEDMWWPHMLRVSATMGPFSLRSSSSVVLLMNKDGIVFTSSKCGLAEEWISAADEGKAYL